MARCDQRAKGEQYVRGLLLEGRRKSIQPMAPGWWMVMRGLQQFVTDSPWDDLPVRRRVARRMPEEEIGVEGRVADDTGLPKAGRWSPGVAHQYCGALGKTANCQVLVSVNAASDRAVMSAGLAAVLARGVGRRPEASPAREYPRLYQAQRDLQTALGCWHDYCQFVYAGCRPQARGRTVTAVP